MASRKSCTHFTWAEAKAKTNPGGVNVKAQKKQLRKQSHNQVLAQKILDKNGTTVKNKSHRKESKRQEQKAMAAAAKIEEERQRKRLAAMEIKVKPLEKAREKMYEMATELKQQPLDLPTNDKDDMTLDEMRSIADCLEMQVQELMALEAMMEDTFMVADASLLSELSDKIEKLRAEEGDEASLLRSIVQHPPLVLILQLEFEDENQSLSSEMELVATILLRVTLPCQYPLTASPSWSFDYVMVTDKLAECRVDKALATLAWLDKDKLQEQLVRAEKDISPDPCVYEMAVTWLSENVFEHFNLQHGAAHS